MLSVTWGNLDYYRKAALISLPISLIFLLIFILMGHAGFLFFSAWFLNLIPIPAFIGTQLSGWTYLGRQMDLIKENSDEAKREKWGTLIGITLGLILGVAVSILSPIGKSCFDVIQAGMFTINCVSSLGGIANRLSSSSENRRPLFERRAISLTALIGLGISIALFATASAAMVSVVGVTSFITGGAALPLWVSGFIFVTSVTSSLASTADYSAKAITFVRSKFSSDKEPQETVSKKLHEYRGSLVGITNGLIIGTIIVVAIAITQPHLFAGLLGVVAATFVITTCISIIGGLCSRIGRILDRLCQINLNDPKTKTAADLAKPHVVKEIKSTPLQRSTSCPNLFSAERQFKAGLHNNMDKKSLKSTSHVVKQLKSNPPSFRRSSSCPDFIKIDDNLNNQRDRHSSKALVKSETKRIHTPRRPSPEEIKECLDFKAVPIVVY